MSNTSVVAHSDADANSVMQQYLRAFTENVSVLVASKSRIESMRCQPWLAKWCTTDCASTFEAAEAMGTDELVIETSGTTGQPKLIRYRKDSLRDCAVAIAESLQLTCERESYVSLVNPRLAYGLSVLHSHRLADVPVTIQPAPISLHGWAEFRNQLRPRSSVYLVPHQSYMLARDGWTFDGPIELIFAGGAVTRAMADRLERSFPNATIFNMYGQAEMGPRIAIGRSAVSDFEEGNVGRPLAGVKVRIAQQDPASRHGEIKVDSPYRMSSYIGVDGGRQPMPSTWWPTGDVGYVSLEGDLNVVGRAAADIIFLGTRVRLAHLADVVRGVPGVLDVGASATEHHVYGQQPSIRVLSEDEAPDVEVRVRRALATSIGSSAAAVRIHVVDPAHLPESGKI